MRAKLVLEKKEKEDITLYELNMQPSPKYSEIILDDFLDYISPNDTINTLSNIKNVLLPQGKISIQGYDLVELAYRFLNDGFSIFDFNLLIENRKQLLSCSDMSNILQQLGFKILNKDIDANKFLIEAINEN